MIHVRPLSLICGDDAREAIASGAAGPLAQPRIGYTAVVVEVGAAGSTTRKWLSYGDFAASRESALRDLRAAIEAERPAIAGLSLDRARIMGIVNVTPDSFSDGGQFRGSGDAIAHGRRLVEEGAHVIDVGGESTRPGAAPLPIDDELARVLPVIEGLKDAGAPISIDTRNAAVMERAVEAGAAIVNDVSALVHDKDAPATAARLDVPVVLMHIKGTPETMQDEPRYDDVCLEVFDTLAERIAACEDAGIARSRLIADPGIGFGKTFTHNVELLRGLTLFHGLGVPLLVGASRKAFIGWLTGEKTASDRVSGSVAAAGVAVAAGAHMVRVHDVRETAQALAVAAAVNGACPD